ncbi:uncharacterized protein VTP21DRAFT_11606 [Calcarisporiella thermophila]|uniref:uncharacterized protein n=1 Tax=Calcarisporiella thermophila TaxID=911321 RepID=UPI003741F3E3
MLRSYVRLLPQRLHCARFLSSIAPKRGMELNSQGTKSQPSQKQSIDEDVTRTHMIPGKYLRYFKEQRKSNRSIEKERAKLPIVRTLPSRNLKTPIATLGTEESQKSISRNVQLSQRVNRALLNMFTMDAPLHPHLTALHVAVKDVQVEEYGEATPIAKVIWQATPDKKVTGDMIEHQMRIHRHRLSARVLAHLGNMRRPPRVRWVREDTKSQQELNEIFELLEKELGKP